MPDWTKPMEQSYEYYTVEPTTLADVKRLDTIKKASFTRDSDSETLGSASFDASNLFGETYLRGYLRTNQNGISEKFPLGTYLVQTPSSSFNGKVSNVTMDAYTPLIELKENRPPLGYTVRKGKRILDEAYRIVSENCRVPVTKVEPLISTNESGEQVDNSPVLQHNFVANTDDTWLSFLIDLLKQAKYELGLEPTGRILFQPKQELESLQPVWTYNDDNSSILYSEITMDHDLYGIPNRVEVIYSYGNVRKEVVVTNEDPNSPTSFQNRGRWITFRDTDPALAGYVSDTQIQDYAERLLKELSTVEYTISYKHAYCPVRMGDCVRLNYTKAGMSGIKAKVVSQNFSSDLACPVSEKAVFTQKLWR
jgi:hypothetical protein